MKRKFFAVILILFSVNLFSGYGSISFYFGNHWISDENIQDIYGINFARYGSEIFVNAFMGTGFFFEYTYMRQFGKTTYFKEETSITLKPKIIGFMVNKGIFVKLGMAFMSFKEEAPIGDFEDSVSGMYYSIGYMGRIYSLLNFRFSLNYLSATYEHRYEDGETATLKLGGISTDIGFALRF